MMKDKTLNGFLDFLEANLKERVKIIIIGGNALVLLGFKKFTKDVDICLLVPNEAVERLRYQYQERELVEVDIFYEGIFKNVRLPDYVDRVLHFESEYTKIDIFILDLLDILLTKMDRMLGRDWNDCYSVFKKSRIKKSDLDKRILYYLDNYIGNDADKERLKENYKILTDSVRELLL